MEDEVPTVEASFNTAFEKWWKEQLFFANRESKPMAKRIWLDAWAVLAKDLLGITRRK